MDELLVETGTDGPRNGGAVSEMKKVSYIAMPMIVTTVSQNMVRVISMMMIGHLGELSLSGAAIATSLTNVTGFSLLVSSMSFRFAFLLHLFITVQDCLCNPTGI